MRLTTDFWWLLILHHQGIVSRIMSELTLKEAVRTSVLSSKWRWYWRCHPNLRFDISTVLGSNAKRNQSSNRYKRMLSIKRSIDRVNYMCLPFKIYSTSYQNALFWNGWASDHVPRSVICMLLNHYVGWNIYAFKTLLLIRLILLPLISTHLSTRDPKSLSIFMNAWSWRRQALN